MISHIDFVTSQNNEFLISQSKKLFYTTEVISNIYFVIKIIMILRYHKFDFVTSKNLCDIINSVLWCLIFFFFFFFFWFCEITTSNLWYHKIEFAISKNYILWYKHQHAFMVSWWFCDVMDLIFYITSSTFWYQKFDFLEITKYCSYYFQILKSVFSDITKTNFWYHKLSLW